MKDHTCLPHIVVVTFDDGGELDTEYFGFTSHEESDDWCAALVLNWPTGPQHRKIHHILQTRLSDPAALLAAFSPTEAGQ